MVEPAAQSASNAFSNAQGDEGGGRCKNHQVPKEPQMLETEIAGILAKQGVGHRIATTKGTEATSTTRGTTTRAKSTRSARSKPSRLTSGTSSSVGTEARGRAAGAVVILAAGESTWAVGELLSEFDLRFLPFLRAQGAILILVEFL